MEDIASERSDPDNQMVGLKAFPRIASAWSLAQREAAALVDLSESTWKRTKKPGWAGQLSKDQILKLSALIGLHKRLGICFRGPNSRD